MKETAVPVTKRSLFHWVWRSSMLLQGILLAVIVVTVMTRVLPLEMQKRIINQAINLRRMDLLLLYCGYYLAAVLLASGLKFVINWLQTSLGEQALADLRQALYRHIISLPVGYFRRTPAGMVVSSLVTEISNVGDFVGMAVAVPLTNILTLVAFAAYMFWLNPLLAAISMAIYPLVLLVIPRLQRRTNEANKQRVDSTREYASKVGEAVSGIHEIHGNGSFRIEAARNDSIVEQMRRIRVSWNLYKFGIKAVNNLFTNLGPFFIFIVGGWLAITGRFDLGALVAFLSAQEKLYDPWKELLEFYQVYQDASVRYERTMEYFDASPEHALEPVGRSPLVLAPGLQVKNLTFAVDGGIRLISDVSLDLTPGEQMALVGFSGSGKSTLAMCIGQLYRYTSGHVFLDGHEVTELTKQDMAVNMGFVSQSPFIFDGKLKNNLLYACQALRSGEDGDDLCAEPSLDELIEILQQTGLFVDVLRFGLNTLLREEDGAQLAERIIRVRGKFQADHGAELAEYVEFFDERVYLRYSTVAANLVFGSSREPAFALDQLHENGDFRAFLDEAHLTRPLMSLGAELAEQTVDILGSLPPDSVFFEHSPVTAEEYPAYRELAARLQRTRLHRLGPPEEAMLLKLGLGFIPGRHKMVALSDILEKLILEGRAMFHDRAERDMPGAVTFFVLDKYIWNQTILDNILFGKSKTESQRAQELINQSIMQLLIEEDLLETIVEIGMHYEVGTKGDKLSGGQRQKLAIARVLLKHPRLLIMDEATSALDNRSQARIQNLIHQRLRGKSTVISVVHRLDTLAGYDKIAVMKAGKIVEVGTYDELMTRKGALHELVRGRQAA
ncbi:ABC-type multidrug transport system, ATPase and permease component [Desulfocurvibacter africanus PCS]|uniref:ABC-type multidrug transport system, ATPase and permease component n=1 Tax=Desulfocurvibacter africanus PCS TaxID=1262666 RepID=M5Q3F0_DESAF|nr:ABC transporter ATP-binding protein/permease [Desulfocurvibacter africanus]EMG38333.1 ABC-type multidrug transport system, ATPase and permease component [Desulfocurvibacter africanus PCS]